jgi:hypothetical protein
MSQVVNCFISLYGTTPIRVDDTGQHSLEREDFDH